MVLIKYFRIFIYMSEIGSGSAFSAMLEPVQGVSVQVKDF